MTLLFSLLSVFSWLLLIGLRSVKVENNLSRFELKRRADAGDKEARLLRERSQALPGIRALLYVAETVLMILAIILTSMAAGFWNGILISFLVLMLSPAICNLTFVCNQSQRLYSRLEPTLIKKATGFEGFLRFFKVKHAAPTSGVSSREELLHVAKKAKGIFGQEELDMLAASLSFPDKTVADVMTPRSVVETVEAGDTLGPVTLSRLHATGHSRFPVIVKNIDHVVGILYMHELVTLKRESATVRSAMSEEVYYIRQDRSLEHALHAFLRTHHHLFIVVNEYRETVGVLSLEDVVEAILGRKIVDEFDAFHDLRAVAEANPQRNNQASNSEDV